MENLKDIKDIVEVSLNSLAILLILSFIAVLILLFLYFKLYLINLNRQQVLLPQKQAFLALENLNFNDAKSCVYQFSQNFIYFLNENNKAEFNALNAKLSEYKYKKDVPNLDKNLKN